MQSTRSSTQPQQSAPPPQRQTSPNRQTTAQSGRTSNAVQPPSGQLAARPAPNKPTAPATARTEPPRSTFRDRLRNVAQNTRARLEGLPRTDQSRGIPAATPQGSPQTYEVARDRNRTPAAAAAAKLTPRKNPSPKVESQPALVAKSNPPKPRTEASAGVKKQTGSTAPVAESEPKSEPAAKPQPKESEPLPAVPEFDDPDVLAANRSAEDVTVRLAPDPAPQAGSDTDELAKAATPQLPVIPGSSIFRRAVEQATATAMAQGSAVLGMAITEEPPEKTAVASKNSDTPPPSKEREDDNGSKRRETQGAQIDDPVESVLQNAVQVAARAGPEIGAELEQKGLSVDQVLDLTKSEDNLPFIEHRPPSADLTRGGTGDLIISAINQTDFDIDSSKMEFSGNVQVKSPRFALRADRFIVHLKQDGSGMAYGEAVGNVYIRMQQDGRETGHEGFASRAIYRPEEGKLTLSGWPKIREKNKEHVAATKDTQMVLYTDGRVKTLGRNRTVIATEGS